MVKKQRTATPAQAPKLKYGKNSKSKSKEMFTELKTHQENKISKFNGIKSQQMADPNQMINQDNQGSFQGNVQQRNKQKADDIEQLCEAVHHLISKNKISAKNAFDIPFIDLQKLEEFEKISQSENGWRKISSTLQNDSKIYSYRVDAIHSIAYKIMNTMTRNTDQEPQQENQQIKKQGQAQIQKLIVPMTHEWEGVCAQLQKNIGNLNMQQMDKLTGFNPTYERTRRRFDQNGLKGMLLNNISLDPNLQLSLNLTRKLKPSGFYEQVMPVNVDQSKQTLQVCKTIQNTKKSIFSITKQEFVPATGYQISWRKVRQGQVTFERVAREVNQNQMDIEMNDERNQNAPFKKVEDAIKMKVKNKISLKSSSDVVQDGLGWLSEMDRKMLGISTKNQITSMNSLIKKATSLKTQKVRQLNEDDIDFDIMKTIKKNQVFNEQTTERHKQEYNQEIEEKHLLPIRLFYKFKVQQILTLREQSSDILHQPDLEDQQQQINEQEREREQIDIKRQQISIRESKDRLKGMLNKQMKFSTLFNRFTGYEKNVTPELCFLTILHLANQNNFKLQQNTDFDFIIRS